MARISTSTLDSIKQTDTEGGRYCYSEGELGRGSFGAVLKATDAELKETVAIKIIEFKSMKGYNPEETAKKEVQILRKLKHENVISIWNDFELQSTKGIAIVTEYCSKGSLSRFLSEAVKHGNHFPEDQRLTWYKELISALEYIHSKKIAHRDIKPANILVNKYNKLKIGDVGLSKIVLSENATSQDTSSLYMTTMCGTYPYTAPEVFQGHYTMKSDVFSMGLVMFIISELPPEFLPQVRADKITSTFSYKLQNRIPGLGLYYTYCSQSLKPMELMEASKSLEDERHIFDCILQPRYQDRPSAAELYEKLLAIEKSRHIKLKGILQKCENDLKIAQEKSKEAEEEAKIEKQKRQEADQSRAQAEQRALNYENELKQTQNELRQSQAQLQQYQAVVQCCRDCFFRYNRLNKQ